MGGLGSIQTSKSEPRSGRGRRAVDCGFRKGPERESVQDLESDVVGQLLSAASADGRNTERRWRYKKTGYTNGGGSDRATSGEVEIRTDGGPAVPSGFLRLSAGEVGAGRSGAGAAEMLAL